MKNLPLIVTALSVFAVHSVQADSPKLVNPSNSHSYQRVDAYKSWVQAKYDCENRGGVFSHHHFSDRE